MRGSVSSSFDVDTYTNTELWSPRYKCWRKYHVMKARLPTLSDQTVDWVDSLLGRPLSFRGLLGDHNDNAIRTLESFVKNFDSTKNLQELTLIHGSSGSGKTLLSHLFVNALASEIDLSTSQLNKWCLILDGSKWNTANYHELWKKIKTFLETQDSGIRTSFKIVVLDNVDTISATHQNSLKAIMDKNLLRLKWIFIANEPRKLIQYFQTKAILVKTKSPSEKTCLSILLAFCLKHKIGYNREGMKALFDLRGKKQNLNMLLSLLQKTFLHRHFISEENIYHSAKLKLPLREVGPYSSIDPISRCKICTLLPPCQHMTSTILISKAHQQRQALPKNEQEVECAEFLRIGKCSQFNKTGLCSFNHPPQGIKVKRFIMRCPKCTIKWPCGHCEYTKERLKLVDTANEIKRRLQLLDTILLDEPPIHIIAQIEKNTDDDWKDSALALKRFYTTETKKKALDETSEWIENNYCIDEEEYIFRNARLKRTYGELYKTLLLVISIES